MGHYILFSCLLLFARYRPRGRRHENALAPVARVAVHAMARGFLAGCGKPRSCSPQCRVAEPFACRGRVVALAAVGVSAKRVESSGPLDCVVTSTWPDGRTEERECQVLSDAAMKPS